MRNPSRDPVLASTRCTGHIGEIKLAGSFMRVSVYAGRMTVTFFGMREQT
jgi:hypothetical protein